MRHWHGVGKHSVWGGLIEGERSELRRGWLDGVAVATPAAAGPKPAQMPGTRPLPRS